MKSIKDKFEKDWWTANGLLWIMTGFYLLIVYLSQGQPVGVSIGLAAINFLAGVALLQHSKVVFWILFVMMIINFISKLLTQAKDPSYFGNISFWIMLLPVVFIVMLWQQIRKEKK